MNQNFMMNLLAFAVLLLDLKLHFVVYSVLIYTIVSAQLAHSVFIYLDFGT